MIPMGNWADRIDELESEVEGLSDEIKELEEMNGRLEEERDSLAEQLDATMTERDAMEARVRDLESDPFYDQLVKEKEQVELQRDDLRSELEYLYEITENETEDYYLVAGQLDTMTDSFLEEWVRANLTQARANSWFEIAKTMVRARDFWVDIADKYAEQLDAALNDYEELQTALRVLGGKKE